MTSDVKNAWPKCVCGGVAVSNASGDITRTCIRCGAIVRAASKLPSAPSPAGEDWFPYPVAAPVSTKGVRSRPYRESLLRDLRDPKEAIAYLSAATEDSPEMYAKALSNVFAAQVAAPDSASLVLVPRNPTPEMFAAAGGKSIANYVWRKMIAAWEDRIE